MAKFLLFQLYGTMQSWGEVAVGEIRPSAHQPTRSGVFGLVAGCMGIQRDDHAGLAALRDGFGFALSVNTAAFMMLDYHTIQMPKSRKKRVYYSRRDELGQMLEPDEKINTILSRREYLTDAHFTVCLWQRENAPHTLQQLANGLNNPAFTPYLGRRSCPPCLPFNPQIVEEPTATAALQGYDCLHDVPGLLDADKRVFHMDADAAAEHTYTILRRDMPADFGKRQFWQRTEAVISPNAKEEQQ